MEQIARTSSHAIAWETIKGRRARWWCKICRDQGLPWLMEPTCAHVLEARPQADIPREEAIATMRLFQSENPTTPPNPGSPS